MLLCSRLVARLLFSKSLHFSEHFKHSASSTVLRSVYAWPPLPTTPTAESTAIVNKIESCTRRVVRASRPGAFLVDIFPPLQYLPEWLWGMGWMREGRKWFKHDTEMFEEFLEDVEIKIVGRPSNAVLGAFHLTPFPDDG